MKTYEVLKPLPGLTVGGRVDEADLEAFGGADRMLELQQVREVVTPPVDPPSDTNVNDNATRRSRNS